MVLNIDERDYLIDGELSSFRDVAPFIQDERTYLPLRAISEAFGAEVDFDDGTITVELEAQDRTALFNLGQKRFFVDGDLREMDVEPYLDEEENRTYLPVRFLSEDVLEAEVDWDRGDRTVTIKY